MDQNIIEAANLWCVTDLQKNYKIAIVNEIFIGTGR